MSFSSTLQDFIDSVGCSAQELAEAAGISPSTISRYLAGSRSPRRTSDIAERIAGGLSKLAQSKGLEGFDEHAAAAALRGESNFVGVDGAFADNLSMVTSAFGIANNQLARFMGFDPSYISRILSGTRLPADTHAFIGGVSAFIVRNHADETGIAIASELSGIPPEQLREPKEFAHAVEQLLETGAGGGTRNSGIDGFLEKLDEFDLNDFLRDVKFDEIKVPTVPFQLPTTKTYEGIEQMKQAELDFLKTAALSRSCDDAIMYSDMPLAAMAADEEFPKKVMMGIAMLIRKGVHLRIIHDVHRPLSELAMGLEGWIPVYMTGQISPYYLPHPTNYAFLHFLRSAGSVAVMGEAVAGRQENGRYTLVKSASDVAYARRRAEDLLACARPLMRIFRSDQAAELERALKRFEKQAVRKNVEPTEISVGAFKNMSITVLSGSYALIEKRNPPQISFLIEYPALVNALERFEPTLL